LSKGLGKVEKKVLEALEMHTGERQLGLPVLKVAIQVHNGLDCYNRDESLEYPPDSVYQSVCRAVRSLERKGLIQAGKRGIWYGGYKRIKRYGDSRISV